MHFLIGSLRKTVRLEVYHDKLTHLGFHMSLMSISSRLVLCIAGCNLMLYIGMNVLDVLQNTSLRKQWERDPINWPPSITASKGVRLMDRCAKLLSASSACWRIRSHVEMLFWNLFVDGTH
jgi:hypothetical protein